VLERERQRTHSLLVRLLQLERGRPPFRVVAREQNVLLAGATAGLRGRVDRIDALADGSRLLIDYKTGRLKSMHLQDGAAEPLQLAAYANALLRADQGVQALALLGLNSAELRFSGATAVPDLSPARMKAATDWPTLQGAWMNEIERLLNEHLAGNAIPMPLAKLCGGCHVTALCRRMATRIAEEDGSGAVDE
jgi:ATP-dependent helicase/nuclease subunit B